jgi:hypothetical protein
MIVENPNIMLPEVEIFKALVSWCQNAMNCNVQAGQSIGVDSSMEELFKPFLNLIDFNKISPISLMTVVEPSNCIPASVLLQVGMVL